ncbi:hypothetical protein EVJ50_03420 [Synechococcus sp. RSCCF101]|uniref:DUF7676 family protein n=1 Tax=Synechococcus sp. RSCCF101 TaxID=2511069 RepID=UPI0012473532|nr:hypothetical protein [Synechococcus sp. RSCCF101]QEY31442.1 hypothetical protein EVJ50_03420 [Synechococcus sp. RSCCF101]
MIDVIGHVLQGNVLELEFRQAPTICLLYDGYLTVVTEGWQSWACTRSCAASMCSGSARFRMTTTL